VPNAEGFCGWFETSVRRLLPDCTYVCQPFIRSFSRDFSFDIGYAIHSSCELVFLNLAFGETVEQMIHPCCSFVRKLEGSAAICSSYKVDDLPR